MDVGNSSSAASAAPSSDLSDFTSEFEEKIRNISGTLQVQIVSEVLNTLPTARSFPKNFAQKESKIRYRPFLPADDRFSSLCSGTYKLKCEVPGSIPGHDGYHFTALLPNLF